MRILEKTLWTCGLLSLYICAAQALVQGADVVRPNIIVIMADDLGYETIGANGGTSYQTPHLDRLATSGARFEHFYVQPLCTPTRVQLMTGLYNVRNYIRFGYMDPTATTFGNRLKSAGYATCIVGKWQLGQDIELPKKFGFDEHCLWQHTRRPPRYANPGLEINGQQRDFSDGEYGPDLVNDYALDFVTRHQNKPFFLYYPLMLTHSPYQPTPDSSTWDPKAIGETVNRDPSHFGHMVEYMDKLIGELVAKLDQLKIRENTLIVFIGDNGTGAGTISMMGDRQVIGAKGKTIKTGMHVPLIVNWPKGISTPMVTSNLADSTDVLPTICEAAGINPQTLGEIDGRSFLPLVQGRDYEPRQWIYSWYSPRQGNDLQARQCAFDQRYKLYRSGEFFDLTADGLEKQPLQIASLTGDAAATAKKFAGVLERFATARPAHLDHQASSGTDSAQQQQKKETQKKNKKKKSTST